jgi:lipopolysaccharide export LptBFGC system permease protein LptF
LEYISSGDWQASKDKMRILEKYVVKDFVYSFIFCITLLIVIGVIGDILGFLGEIFEKHIPLSSILAFYFYLAPFAFVNMVPFACLLAAVYVFNSLSKNHEITAVIAKKAHQLTHVVLCMVDENHE